MTGTVRALLSVMFFVSGLCGLVYQVVWIRLAFASFGIVTAVLSVVVSVFMLGIALGSALGGRFIAQPSRRRTALRWYALVELGIGCSAFVVPAAFRAMHGALLDAGAASSFSHHALSALCITVAVLPWCLLMGATYPFVMAFVRDRAPGDEQWFGRLYVANVVGAMAGSLLAAFVLVELLGFAGTLGVAAAGNVAVALLALGLGARPPATAPVDDVPAPAPPRTTLRPALILFVTGFSSMAMEVVWTRAFVRVLGHEVYSFAALLFVYLFGTAIGSAAYRGDLRRRRVRDSALLLAASAIAALLPVVVNDVRWISAPFAARAALLSIIPFSAVLGYLTPRLVDEVAQGAPDRAGNGYAWNVLGCIIGPLVACYLLLPFFSSAVSLTAATAVLVLALVATGAWRARPRFVLAATLSTVAVAAFAVTSHVPYEDPYAGAERSLRVVRRDATATVIASSPPGRRQELWVNGSSVTSVVDIVQHMAHLPLVVHGRAEKALVICFGMGSTWRSLMSWGIEATAVELVPSVVESFPAFHADAAALLANPRGRIVVDDGRRFLQRSNESFDVITIDPPPPIEAAGSGLLYTDEMYDLIKKRLRKGGLLHQWLPTGDKTTKAAVARSVVDAFPHVRIFKSVGGWGYHFFASMEPFDVPTRAAIDALLAPAARADLAEQSASGDVVADLAAVLEHELSRELLLVDDPSVRMRDDRPVNEYFWIRRTFERGLEELPPALRETTD